MGECKLNKMLNDSIIVIDGNTVKIRVFDQRFISNNANNRFFRMSQLEYRKTYNLDDLISKIMNGYKKDNFCLYTKEYESSARADLICYLEIYPVIGGDDEEIYPEFVINNSLELFFMETNDPVNNSV